jgi:hypothetical protein
VQTLSGIEHRRWPFRRSSGLPGCNADGVDPGQPPNSAAFKTAS